jgi:uncharacterized protein (TIGR02099 family)
MSTETPEQQSPAAEPAGGVDHTRPGFWRRCVRQLRRTLVLLLVLCTVYVSGGRLLMPALTTQKDKVEERLSQLLGTQVSIATLEGSWYRFSPGFAVGGLVLQLDPADPATRFAIESGELSLDLWSTFQLGRLSLGQVTLNGLELSLQQSADGRWTLRGLPPGDRDYKDLILDLLLKTPGISLEEASVRINLADGQDILLQSVYLQLDNAGRRHDLSLQFRLGTQSPPQQALLQLTGDPRSTFRGDAWLSLVDLDLRAQLATLLPEGWQLDNFTLDSDLWLELDQRGLRSLKARVDDLQAIATQDNSSGFRLTSATLDLGAWPEVVVGARDPVWQLTAQNIAIDFNDVLLAPGTVNLRLPLDAAQPWTLQAHSLDVATLAAFATSLPLPDAGRQALQQLAPVGRLGPLTLESDRSGNYPDGFLLRTQFEDLAVGAWRSAPAGTGLRGFAEVVAGRGFAEVDARDASIHLPTLFRAPWQYEQLNTRINWSLAPGEVQVSSTPIAVRSPDLEGRVQFSLHNTGMGTPAFRSDLSLAVGMDWMNVAVHSDYLPTLQRTADTMRWLDEALVDGRIVDSGFLLRNSSTREPGLSSLTHSSWFRVENGVLRFLPDWPLVSIASAGVLVRDQYTDVSSSEASIAGINATQVQAQVRPFAGGGSLLDLRVEALAETGVGLDFLRDTPVKQQVGSALDGWGGEGNLQVNLALQQPLGGAAREQSLEVLARAMDSTLRITPYQLDIAGLNGVVRYRNDSGLQAEQLQGRLFDQAVALDIDTLQSQRGAARSIRVTGSGRVETTALAAWEGQSAFVRDILGFASGAIAYRAQVDIPAGGSTGEVPRLQLRSDLVGMATTLPAPFDKQADDSAQLQLDLRFPAGTRELSLRYQDWLSGQLILDDGSVARGQLYFGSLNRDFNIRQSSADAQGLLVNGELPDFDYDAWSEVARSFAADDTGGSADEGAGLHDYLRLVDVGIGRLQVIGQEFSDIDVEVLFRDGAWHIHGSNEKVSGNLVVPLDGANPWQVDLDYLRFPPRPEPDPEATEPPEDIDLLEDVDPTQLPAFAFSTDELSIGPSNLGSWRFDFAPRAGGARISNLRMQEESSRIQGVNAEGATALAADNGVAGAGDDLVEGASVDWNYRAGVHNSRFSGVFAANDLAKVMPKWGHDANVVSRNANFDSVLTWPGSPLAFSLKKASGDIDMAINNGRFVDIESGSSRLLGAFNFDSLVRRLELDFSDIYQRGFSFDTIRGELGFTDGVVAFTTPLVIDGPSSRISIEGEINLPLETIAADMQVRIPLGENISMLAGLLGAWPIAVSTYIASKIFASQVEDFTTIIYRLDGPWSDPQAGFEPPEDAVIPATP